MGYSRAIFLLMFAMLFLSVGVFYGMNLGIYWSYQLTPEKACDAYKLCVYVLEDRSINP